MTPSPSVPVGALFAKRQFGDLIDRDTAVEVLTGGHPRTDKAEHESEGPCIVETDKSWFNLADYRPMRVVYRVENTDKQYGLWRDFDGTWNPKFHLLRHGKCRDMPMEDNPMYGAEGKRWFASAPTKDLLREWFSLRDLEDLAAYGFKVYELIVTKWKEVSEFETIFPRDAIVRQKEISISEIYPYYNHPRQKAH